MKLVLFALMAAGILLETFGYSGLSEWMRPH
jgi:hypothetical protein